MCPPSEPTESEPTEGTVEVTLPTGHRVRLDEDPESSESNGIDSGRTDERVSAVPISSSEMELLATQIRPDRYTILGRIGEGGMAVVYVARDDALRRHVALKLQRADRESHASRFLEEAQVLGRLEHPNIVPLYTLENGAEGTPFTTMRYLRGSSLQQVLRGLRGGDPRVTREYSLTRLMQIFLQITQAVAYAHNQGIIHRDLKPANVMLGEHGEVQVVDWGVAKVRPTHRASPSSRPELATPGQILGTPAYMAPEQWAGFADDERVDIYSLGVMLYELLTLRRPFEATSPLALWQAVTSTPPTPPRTVAPDRGIPLELERTCLKALSKRPSDRQEQVLELYRAVQTWIETETDKARRHALAEGKVAEARGLLLAYKVQRERIVALARAAQETARLFESWQSVEEKRALYAAEEEVQGARRQLIDISTDVVGVLTEALGFERENAAARELLADYYWDRLLEAEQDAVPSEAEFYARLVQRYHDGKYTRQLSGEGVLSLTTDPPGASVRVRRLEEIDLRMQPKAVQELGPAPIENTAIAQGSYLLEIEHPTYPKVVYPVHVSRNREWREHVRIYSAAEIGEGFVHVPAGPFIEGGDREGWSLPRSEPHVDDFAIARYPVTVVEYLEFLNALARTDPEEARRRAPRRAPDGGSYTTNCAGGSFEMPLDLPDGIGEPLAPVSSISWYDAVAYCEWRSARDGRVYRLPSAREWEKAARGVDGRWFPWGNRFDSSLCNIRESMQVAPRAAPVDAFPTDESVYGVRGMAGNMRDWTSTESDQGAGSPAMRVVRGGAWYGGRVSARCADRFWFEPNHVYFFVGFRLAHSLGQDSR
jgi:serine/threonine-protein kinase